MSFNPRCGANFLTIFKTIFVNSFWCNNLKIIIETENKSYCQVKLGYKYWIDQVNGYLQAFKVSH